MHKLSVDHHSMNEPSTRLYRQEYWHGNSRNGLFLNIEGYHYFELNQSGDIFQAFEYFETEEGEEYIFVMENFIGINWYNDLGYSDDELLEQIEKQEFLSIAQRAQHTSTPHSQIFNNNQF